MIKIAGGIFIKESGLLSAIRSVGPRKAGVARQTQLYYEHMRRLAAKREARRIAEDRAASLLKHPEQSSVPQIAPFEFGAKKVVPPNPTKLEGEGEIV